MDPDQTAPLLAVWSGPRCLPVCKNRFEKFARIFSRRHKQTTFSDAGFLGILWLKYIAVKGLIEQTAELTQRFVKSCWGTSGGWKTWSYKTTTMECWSIYFRHCAVIIHRPINLRVVGYYSCSTSWVPWTALQEIKNKSCLKVWQHCKGEQSLLNAFMSLLNRRHSSRKEQPFLSMNRGLLFQP